MPKRSTGNRGSAPANDLNKIFLLKALRAALRNDRETAHARFKESIHHAQRSGFLNEEALAHELAGRICLDWDETFRAKALLERAVSLYNQWGSPAKAFQVTSILPREHTMDRIPMDRIPGRGIAQVTQPDAS